MNNLFLRFDSSIFNNPGDIKNINGGKGNRLGFYREGNAHVFTLEAFHHKEQKLITDSRKISHVLNYTSFNNLNLRGITLEKQMKSIDYLNCVHTIIDKHNEKLKEVRRQPVIRILLVIPLINYFVAWVFADLEQPFTLTQNLIANTIEKGFTLTPLLQQKISKQMQELNTKEKIENEVKKLKFLEKGYALIPKQSTFLKECFKDFNIKNLEKIKLELLETIKKARKEYPALENLEVWEQLEKKVLETFETRIKEIVPRVARAEKILKLREQKPEYLYKETLHLRETDSLQQANQFYQDALKTLEPIPELSDQFKQLLKEATIVIKQAYNQWIAQFILKFDTEIPADIEKDIWGFKEEESFEANLKTLLERLDLFSLNEGLPEKTQKLILEATNLTKKVYLEHLNLWLADFYGKLETSKLEKFKDYLIKKLKKELEEYKNLQFFGLDQLIVSEIDKAFETQLKISFPIIHTAEDLLKQKESRPEHIYNQILQIDLDLPLAVLDVPFDVGLKACKELLKALEIPLDNLSIKYKTICQNASKVVNEAYQSWFADKINMLGRTPGNELFIEILNLKRGDTVEAAVRACNLVLKSVAIVPEMSEQTQKAMQEASAVIKKAYGQWLSQRLLIIKERCEKQEEDPTISEIFGTEDATTFSRKYSSLCKILSGDIPGFQQSLLYVTTHYEKYLGRQTGPFIQLIQNREAALFALLPEGGREKLSILEATYENYQRSIRLQSLMNVAAKSVRFKLVFQDIFPKAKEGVTTLKDLELIKTQRINDLDIELMIQGKREKIAPDDPVIVALGKMKEQISSFWEAYLITKIPIYRETKKIVSFALSQEKNWENEVNLNSVYASILYASIADLPHTVFETYSRLFKSFDITHDRLPDSVKENMLIARSWVSIAYKVWEADRIINNENQPSRVLLGLNEGATFDDKRKRYKTLQLLLHYDKNLDLPIYFRNRLEIATKLLSPDLCKDMQ